MHSTHLAEEVRLCLYQAVHHLHHHLLHLHELDKFHFHVLESKHCLAWLEWKRLAGHYLPEPISSLADIEKVDGNHLHWEYCWEATPLFHSDLQKHLTLVMPVVVGVVGSVAGVESMID